MPSSILPLKKEMCNIGHRVWLKGFCAGNEGNHSIRISDDRILCTPTGLSKGFLTPDQITLVDMDGKQIDKKNKHRRTSEIFMHIHIYKKRPDVKAIIHSHPPHATAFAVARVPIPEGIHPEAEVFLGNVPFAPYTTPGDSSLGRIIAEIIQPDTSSVLMASHGTVSFSDTLERAFYRLEILDAYCRVLLLTKQVGQINVFDHQQMIDLLAFKKRLFNMPDGRTEAITKAWDAQANNPFVQDLANAKPTRLAPEDLDAIVDQLYKRLEKQR